MSNTNDKIADFDARQNCESTRDKEMVYFSNSAQRGAHHHSELCEAIDPANGAESELKYATRVLQFHACKAKNLRTAYDALDEKLSHYIPADKAEEESFLQQLRIAKQAVDAQAVEVVKASSALDMTEIRRNQRAMQQERAAQNARVKDWNKKRQDVRRGAALEVGAEAAEE